MNRYQWKKVGESPQRHQLIDSVTEQSIATVEEADSGWKWERKTNYLLHRAHPGKGTAETLILAKIAVVHELPDDS